MNNSSSKDMILEKIRKAKKNLSSDLRVSDNNAQVYKGFELSLIEIFKQELETVSGHCKIFHKEEDLAAEINKVILNHKVKSVFCKEQDIKTLLAKKEVVLESNDDNFYDLEAAITTCEYLVARTGTVVVSSKKDSGRKLNIFPPIHIVIAKTKQIVEYVDDALFALKERYHQQIPSMISFISGPSRTADIEKTLVLGAHGPKELYVFILD